MKKNNSKLDKIAGTLKEGTGKIIGSEQLELEGKLQKKKGEISEAASDLGESLKEKGESIKEKASEKVNDLIDKLDKKEK